jgi:DNA-binding MarR family transcriptional regulator
MTTALDRSFTYRLHLLHKASDQISHQSYLQALGLSLSEARCLAAIGAFQPMSVMALADKGNLNKGQASRAAQILVDKGWVSKTEHPSDGRGVTLCLTPEGQKLWKKTMALIDQRNEAIFGCLNAQEQATFSRLLDRLIAHNLGA